MELPNSTFGKRVDALMYSNRRRSKKDSEKAGELFDIQNSNDIKIKTKPSQEYFASLDCTWWLEFEDFDMQLRYQNFRQTNFYFSTFFTFMVVMTFIYALRVGVALVLHISLLFFSVSIITLFLTIVLGWMIIYYRFIYLSSFDENTILTPSVKRSLIFSAFLDNMFVICNSLCWGLVLVARCDQGRCNGNESKLILSGFCNPEMNIYGIPQDTVFILILLPLFIQSLLKGNQWWATFTAWLISLVLIGISISMVGSWAHSLTTMLIAVAIGAVLYEVERQTLNRFLQAIRMERYLDASYHQDQELLATQMKSEKLSGVLANVAHDLRTPMTSFENILNKIENSLLIIKRHHSFALDLRNTLQECIHSIIVLSATSQYMGMIMNRSLGYSGTNSLYGPEPVLESVDVQDSVLFSVRCVRALEASKGIPIQVDRIPDDICTHIKTDKLWFRENLVCLVSNAVKYTESGGDAVKVTISLDLEKPIRPLLRVEVTDSGCGVPREAIKNLFRSTPAAGGTTVGCGLGLHNVSVRMSALGGDCGMKLRGKGQRGSIFWFAIPYEADKSATSNIYRFTSSDYYDNSFEDEKVEHVLKSNNNSNTTNHTDADNGKESRKDSRLKNRTWSILQMLGMAGSTTSDIELPGGNGHEPNRRPSLIYDRRNYSTEEPPLANVLNRGFNFVKRGSATALSNTSTPVRRSLLWGNTTPADASCQPPITSSKKVAPSTIAVQSMLDDDNREYTVGTKF